MTELKQSASTLAAATRAMFQNQEILIHSVESHDAQISVLTRLVVSTLNRVIKEAGLDSKIPLIVYESIGSMFKELHDLRSIPGFDVKNRDWYMGEDVSEFISQHKASEGAPEAESDLPEGAFVFGGDYRAKEDSNECECCHADEVPSLQGADDTIQEYEDGGSSVSVPQV